MGGSKFGWIIETIDALGGAKGLILIITTILSLGTGGFKWYRAVQAEGLAQNVIEGQKILIEQQYIEPPKPIPAKPITYCPDKCKKYIDAEIYRLEEEYHK